MHAPGIDTNFMDKHRAFQLHKNGYAKAFKVLPAELMSWLNQNTAKVEAK
jgi:hypothetical protein